MTRYRIMSRRLGIPVGSVVSEAMLPAGCNIAVLLKAGLLARVEEPKKTSKFKPPVDPEPEPADTPEEQD